MAHRVPKWMEELKSIPEDSPEALRFTQDKGLLVKPLYLGVKGVNFWDLKIQKLGSVIFRLDYETQIMKYHQNNGVPFFCLI